MNKTEYKIEPGKQEYFITREFDAPRELVFKIYADPKFIPLWWGPREFTTTVLAAEVQAGGTWRYVHTDPQGSQYGFHGVYHEVKAPERIIQTFEFEDLPESGHVVLSTVIFEELPGGRTRLVSQDLYQSVADRDGMLQAGMEGGLNESFERMDELLVKLREKA
ncbi:MAG: SRPBCC family protein [Anaerolineaceae bacterium]